MNGFNSSHTALMSFALKTFCKPPTTLFLFQFLGCVALRSASKWPDIVAKERLQNCLACRPEFFIGSIDRLISCSACFAFLAIAESHANALWLDCLACWFVVWRQGCTQFELYRYVDKKRYGTGHASQFKRMNLQRQGSFLPRWLAIPTEAKSLSHNFFERHISLLCREVLG